MERDVEVGFSSGDINRKTPPSSRLDGYREEEPDSILGVPGVVRSACGAFLSALLFHLSLSPSRLSHCWPSAT